MRLSFFDKLLFVINFVFSLLLLLSFAAPYISAIRFPAISLLSLAVPILVLLNLLFLFYWLFRRKRPFLLSFLALVLGYFFLGTFFKFKFTEEPIMEEDLSIMSYNVRGFNKYGQLDRPDVDKDIVAFVKEKDPDIICFQEYNHIKTRQFGKHKYSYSYVNDIGKNEKVVIGLLSKFPVISEGSLEFPDSHNNAIYVDILYKNDTIRIYNLHLESLKLIPNAETISEEPSGRLYNRLKTSFAKQTQQAKLFKEHQGKVPYKKIVCGDLNNTQFSNVYNTVKGNMQDTFDGQGTGYGRTYNFKYFPVRIDFIFADKAFQVKAHQNFDVELSDHLPVMASFRLKE